MGKAADESEEKESTEQGVTPIQSIQRAVSMLNLFSARRTSLTLAEMRSELGMTVATAHRYAITLRYTGLLHYEASARTYSLGPKAILFGTIGLNGLALNRIATKYLDELVKQTNLTATLAIWDGDGPVVIRTNDQTDGLVSITVRVGTRLPTRSSAAGKVFLAFSQLAREAVGLDAGTSATRERPRTKNKIKFSDGAQERTNLLRQLEETKRTGIGINTDTLPGFCSIAAPVLRSGELVGVLVLNGTAVTLPARADSDTALKLLNVAREFGRSLEGQDRRENGKDY